MTAVCVVHSKYTVYLREMSDLAEQFLQMSIGIVSGSFSKPLE